MLNPITQEHWLDAEGRPAGGASYGPGFAISWQNGPLRADGVERPQNGAFVESVLAAIIGRMQFYQSGQFACGENAVALTHMQAALDSLNARTQRRTAQGVEGTHGADNPS